MDILMDREKLKALAKDQRIMQSFKNLAEGTFDEAFAKIVHTKLYQIRLLRHNPDFLFVLIWQ
ncbi:hypothetical protein [Undibacterium sp. WLHG33]|uniref:hypothetical protein n=1 Tax=Undibacterium sp. WLHG33 TaxID=3412482 RepID=UPI003C2CB8DC